MTFLRRRLGPTAYKLVLGALLVGALIYQEETGRLPAKWRIPIEFSRHASETSLSSSEVRVVRVIDGDTFEIEGGERVRLIGIDTPETVKPNAPVECYGKEASEYLRGLIEGKIVRLERDQTDRDRYARLLRYAYLGEVFVNEKTVREGYAESVEYKPDTARQIVLDQAEQLARLERRGRWAENSCQ